MAAQTRPIALALLLFGLSRQQVDALEEAVISPVAGLDSLEAPMIPIHQLSRLRGSTQDNNIRVLQGNSQTTQGYSASERAFANQCVSELLSDSVLFDGIISQKEFAGGMNKFCQLFTASAMALDPAFACPNDEFYSLPTGVQLLFSEVICGKEDTMQTRMKCLDDLRDLNSMGYDYGYIVTDEKMADVQMGVDNMCINLMPFVFIADGPGASNGVPASNPAIPTPAPVTSTSAPANDVDTIIANSNSTMSSSFASGDGEIETQEDPLDLTAVGSVMESQDGQIIQSPGNDGLGTGPIIGIAAAAVACLFFFLLLAGRRRNREKDGAHPAADNKAHQGAANRNLIMDSVIRSREIVHRNTSALALPYSGEMTDESHSSQSDSDSEAFSVGSIMKAIDTANWDEVYRLASELAEQEDLTTVSSAGKSTSRRFQASPNQASRCNLSKEDLERARTLDKLVDSGDWTGLAVTAALYAGESGGPSRTSPKRNIEDIVKGKKFGSQALIEDAISGIRSSLSSSAPPPEAFRAHSDDASLEELRERVSSAVGLGDWDKVASLSTEIESNSAFLSPRRESSTSEAYDYSVRTLRTKLDEAVHNNDWGAVAMYASRIQRQNLSSDPSLTETEQDVSHHSFKSATSTDSNTSKQQTIFKLVEAGKWKGVSIMAGLYGMESKNSTIESDHEAQSTSSEEEPRGIDPPPSSAQSNTAKSGLNLKSDEPKEAVDKSSAHVKFLVPYWDKSRSSQESSDESSEER